MNPAGTQLGTRVAFSFETLAHDARSRERYAAARVKHIARKESTAVDDFFAKTTNAKDRRENAKTR